jgi:hypothetical protein
MLADTQILENILTQVKQLSPEYRLRLVQRIIQTLISPMPSPQPQLIRFGEFSGDEASMSTLEDFALAEWRPTDRELDGP